MGHLVWGAMGPSVELTELDVLPIVQWILRVLCFVTGFLMINAWRKEVRAELGGVEGWSKKSKANLARANQFIQGFKGHVELVRNHVETHVEYFCSSRLWKWVQLIGNTESNEPDISKKSIKVEGTVFSYQNPVKDSVFRKVPSDEDTPSGLESLLNQLALFTNDKTKSAKVGLSSSQLKEEIHANLLAQRALRGAITLKYGGVAQRVYDQLSGNQIAIGKGTFELMIQAALCSGETQTAKNCLAKMESLGQKANESLVLLVETERRKRDTGSQKQTKSETSEKAAQTPQEEGKIPEAPKNGSLKQEDECLVPKATEVPRTALAFCPEAIPFCPEAIPYTRLTADIVKPEVSCFEMPCPSFAPQWPKFNSFHFQGVDVAEPGKHNFLGQITVVDFLRPAEDFDGLRWLKSKLLNQEPIGWDIEWRPDLEQGSDNPVALMQFASEDMCLLLRTHRTERWLPQVVRQILCSEEVPKISYAYDVSDRQKMLSSFGFQAAGVVDIVALSYERGLVFRGLRDLAQRFQFRMKKDARITCSDWACPSNLTREQIQYAAEDAYFAYLIHKELGGHDRRYAMNSASQHIADSMRNTLSQMRVAPLHPMMLAMPYNTPVLPGGVPAFPYQHQLLKYMQTQVAQPVADPWHTSSDPWEAAAMNKSEAAVNKSEPAATTAPSKKRQKIQVCKEGRCETG